MSTFCARLSGLLDIERFRPVLIGGREPVKAIIDMLIVVEDVSDEASFVTPLMEGGFVLRVREPDHRMMRTPERDAHLHFFEPHADAISACLDLREQLRRSPEDRELYATTKRALARRIIFND